MILSYTLKMPGRNTWDGRWSGDAKLFVLTRSYGARSKELAAKILTTKVYRYSWSDGWAASIVVNQVDSKESTRLRKKSAGFLGYDWMVRIIEERPESARILTKEDISEMEAVNLLATTPCSSSPSSPS